MFSLRIKLFLAILLASALLIVGLLGLMQWSFTTGFGNYLRQQQQQRLESVANELAEHFAETGHWDNLDPQQLRRKPKRGMPDLSPHERMGPPPHPRHGPFILDAHKAPVLGLMNPQDEHVLLPITVDDRVVGYVGERIRKGPQDFMERKFAEHQSRHFILFGALAIAVSLLVAFPLASLLVRRIQRLLEHIQQLSKGNFTAATSTQGRDELSQLAVHLNALGQTLQQNAQSHRTLVADISHELRTPIAVLKAQLEAVEDGVQPLNSATVQRLQQQVSRLARLVNDLYQLSLADLGALSYTKEMLDLRALVLDQVEAFQAPMEQAGLTLAVQDHAQRSLHVLGDAQRLQQLLGNLLQNSVQYTHAPGRVAVDISTHGKDAVIRIADSAPGVPKDLQPRLFERLFRAESSRNRNSGGAGLGLSLCQSITQAHGGSIEISDSPLGGIAVCVRIPLASS